MKYSSLIKACMTSLLLSLCLSSAAFALDVTSATAKPNENGGAVMGGMPTRITWEAMVENQETITNLSLELPADTQVSPDTTSVTLLEGLNRLTSAYTVTVDTTNATTVHVAFESPVPAQTLIRVQAENATLPVTGGTFSIEGEYISGEGTTHALAPSPEITYTTVTTAERISAWLADQSWVQAWNSNTFLHLFFDPTIMATSIPQVAKGWLISIGLVACGIPLAIPIGFVFSLLRMSSWRVLRAIASVYVNIVRGTPMFLQIYIAFFGLPLLGLALDNFVLGALVMAINSGAYLCEIFRVGIQSINKGQFEAARSLGMTAAQTMRFVILPQAFKRVLPTMTNECILLYKDTSLLAAVGIMETVMYAKVITAATGNITPYIVAAFFYLIVTLPLSAFTRRLEEETVNAPSRAEQGKKPCSWKPSINNKRDVLRIKTADL